MTEHPELKHRNIGYDSLTPDLGKDGEIAGVKRWLEQSPDERFPGNTIETAVEQIRNRIEIEKDKFELQSLDSNSFQSMENLCRHVLKEIRQTRHGAFGKLLENLKRVGLSEVLKNSQTREALDKSDFHPEVIDILVTKEILGSFFSNLSPSSESDDPINRFSSN